MYVFATLGSDLGISTLLEILEVGPRSGMIFDLLTAHPPTARSKEII